MLEEEKISEEEVVEKAKILWEKYLTLTEELLKFINQQDVETFLSLVPQRDQLIELMEELPSKDYLQREDFKEIGKKIIPMDREIMYKARAWLNKSRRQNSVVKAYDLTSSVLGAQSVAFNRTY